MNLADRCPMAALAGLLVLLAPFGVLDAPGADEPIAGERVVSGWALDNLGVSAVELWIDGALAAALPYGLARPDVCEVWPGYAGCDAVGFAGAFDFSTLTPCQHLLEIRATDTDGTTRVIARRRVVVNG